MKLVSPTSQSCNTSSIRSILLIFQDVQYCSTQFWPKSIQKKWVHKVSSNFCPQSRGHQHHHPWSSGAYLGLDLDLHFSKVLAIGTAPNNIRVSINPGTRHGWLGKFMKIPLKWRLWGYPHLETPWNPYMELEPTGFWNQIMKQNKWFDLCRRVHKWGHLRYKIRGLIYWDFSSFGHSHTLLICHSCFMAKWVYCWMSFLSWFLFIALTSISKRFPKMVVPQNGGFMMENPVKIP